LVNAGQVLDVEQHVFEGGNVTHLILQITERHHTGCLSNLHTSQIIGFTKR